MTTHTADCSSCDFRLNKVPAYDWAMGETRPLYEYRGEYPSTLSKSRGWTWHPKNLEGSESQLNAWGEESVLTGSIPQVPHTYALIEAGYGIINEHQVAIGESTCAARFVAVPTSAGGKARIEVREMSRLALERTRSAREAIQLMGDLAEQYGFYGADWSGGDASLGEAGEALTVIDPTEGWVYHVLADDTATSAIWVAQRVPDDHVAVVANMFIIREVPREPSPDFMYSSNLFEIAERHRLIEPGAPLDFSFVYGLPRAHSPYCTRRVWRVQSLLAPSLNLSPTTDMYGSDYPFSVKIEVPPLDPTDLMRIQRDHYEGTAFDMTQGFAAGPFGDPQRFDPSGNENNMTALEIVQGGFERAISMFRTSYSIVAQARASVPAFVAPRVWFCQYAPHSSSYAPFYVNQNKIPAAYTRGSLFRYDPSSAFWAFLAAGNYASRFYKFAMQDVFAVQSSLQSYSVQKAKEVEAKITELLANSRAHAMSVDTTASLRRSAVAMLDAFSENQADTIVNAWNELLPLLITKYHDGYRAESLDKPTISMHKFFYPRWWLEAAGFFNNKPNLGPEIIMFQPHDKSSVRTTFLPLSLLVTLLLVALGAGYIGYFIGSKRVERSVVGVQRQSMQQQAGDHGAYGAI